MSTPLNDLLTLTRLHWRARSNFPDRIYTVHRPVARHGRSEVDAEQGWRLKKGAARRRDGEEEERKRESGVGG